MLYLFRTHITYKKIAHIYGFWCIICLLRTSEHAACNIAIYHFISLLSAFIFLHLLPSRNIINAAIIITGFFQSIVVIMQQLGIIKSNHPFFEITGFMGNPGQLGGFQAIALISILLILCESKQRNHILQSSLYISTLIISYSLIFANSRASIVAILIGIWILFNKWFKSHILKHNYYRHILIIIILLSSIIIYYIRTASADARLFVWRVSTNMILDRPLSGFGTLGFNKYYMLYQSEYFRNYPDSRFIYIADNVAYPYNEMIHIVVEQGIIGMILFILFILSIIAHTSDFRKTAPLMTLLTFSFFSYPSYKPVLAILFPALIASILPQEKLFPEKRYNIAIYIMIAILHLTSSALMFSKHKSYIKSTKIISDKNIRDIFPSCENWCAIGCFYAENNQFQIAEDYFEQAAEMIPTRIRPNYLLWQLYVKQGNIAKAEEIGTYILTQPIKIENTYTIKAKAEIKNWLQIHNKSNLVYDNF